MKNKHSCGCPGVGIQSIVVFNNSVEFKSPLPNNVIKLAALNSYILEKKVPMFTVRQLTEFHEKLNRVLESTSKADYKRHLKQVKKRKLLAGSEC